MKLVAETSFHFLRIDNPIRKACLDLVFSRYFRYFILLVLVCNAVQMGFMNPDDHYTGLHTFLLVSEVCFVVVYVVEAIVKLIAFGVILEPNTYFRSWTHILEFSLAVLGIITLAIPWVYLVALRAVRILRIALIQPNLKAITKTLFGTIPTLARGVLLLYAFILFVFALVGIQLFKGVYRQRCYDEEGEIVPFVEDYFEDERVCYRTNYLAVYDCPSETTCKDDAPNRYGGKVSFDHLLWGLLTVFTSITTDGWAFFAYDVMDGYSVFAIIYFSLIILVLTFVLVVLITTVIYAIFSQEIKGAYSVDMNRDQQRHRTRQTIIQFFKRIRDRYCKPCINPNNSLSSSLREFVSSAPFQYIMMLLVFGNTIILCIDHYPINKGFEDALNYTNTAFLGIYILELFLKLLAFGVVGYFFSIWHLFEFIIVVTSIIAEIAYWTGGDIVQALVALRAIRIMRNLILARKWRSIYSVMKSMGVALLAVIWLIILLALVVYAFAVAGMVLFAGRFVEEDGEVPRSNFDNIWWSYVVVFQVLCGDTWGEVLHNGMNYRHDITAFYFIAIWFFGIYGVLSVFLAVIATVFNSRPEEEVELLVPALKVDPRAEITIEDTEVILSTDLEHDRVPHGRSFFIFPPNFWLRFASWKLVINPAFEYVILFLILVNCVILALDYPGVETKSPYGQFLWWSELLFVIAYTLEMLVKMVAWGVFFESNAYLKSPWNWLDFIIVVVSIVGLIVGDASGVAFGQLFRALRPLRILKFMSKNTVTRALLATLFQATRVILQIAFVWLWVWLVFGCAGVILFKGQFFYCTEGEEIEHKSECEGEGKEWINRDYHFDNLGVALVTLFVCMLKVLMIPVVYAAVDIAGIDHQPIRDNRPWLALFFIIWVVISNFILLNVFIGVIIDLVMRLRKKFEGFTVLNEHQRIWLKAQKLIHTFKSFPELTVSHFSSMNKWRLYQAFEIGSAGLLVINAIVLSTTYYDEPEYWTTFLWIFNIVFVGLFIVELLIRFILLGPRLYILDPWNLFDVVVVTTALVFVVVPNLPQFANALRTLRLLKTIVRLHWFRKPLLSIYWAIIPVFPVFLILFLVLYIYAIIGVALFGELTLGMGVTIQANFRHFGWALYAVFRLATFDTWPVLLYDSWYGNPRTGCDGGWEECGKWYLAIPYYITFMMFAVFIVLSLFIAVLAESFLEASEIQDKIKNYEHLYRFNEEWVSVDPDFRYEITPERFLYLLSNLGSDFGFEENWFSNTTEVLNKLFELNVPLTNKGLVTYRDALAAVTTNIFQPTWENIKVVSSTPKLIVDDTVMTVAHAFAATVLQRRYKGKNLGAMFSQLLEEDKKPTKRYSDLRPSLGAEQQRPMKRSSNLRKSHQLRNTPAPPDS